MSNIDQNVVDAVRVAMGVNPAAGYNSKPSQFQVFKGKSAMRVQLDKPNRQQQEFKVGCLFLQVASAQTGQGQGYDWENGKISVKIGVNDISKIIYGLRSGNNVDLFHEFGGDTKTIKLNKNEQRGGYFLSVQQGGSSGERKVNVPLSSDEITAFVIMLEAALPLIHNWN